MFNALFILHCIQCRFVCRLLPRREILAPFLPLPFLCLRDRLFDLLRRVRLPPAVVDVVVAAAVAGATAGAATGATAGDAAVVVATGAGATVVVAGATVVVATADCADTSAAVASVFACSVLSAATCILCRCKSACSSAVKTGFPFESTWRTGAAGAFFPKNNT